MLGASTHILGVGILVIFLVEYMFFSDHGEGATYWGFKCGELWVSSWIYVICMIIEDFVFR